MVDHQARAPAVRAVEPADLQHHIEPGLEVEPVAAEPRRHQKAREPCGQHVLHRGIGNLPRLFGRRGALAEARGEGAHVGEHRLAGYGLCRCGHARNFVSHWCFRLRYMSITRRDNGKSKCTTPPSAAPAFASASPASAPAASAGSASRPATPRSSPRGSFTRRSGSASTSSTPRRPTAPKAWWAARSRRSRGTQVVVATKASVHRNGECAGRPSTWSRASTIRCA